MRLKPSEASVRAGHIQHQLARRFDRPARPAVSWELRVKAKKSLSEVAPEIRAAFLRARAAAANGAAAASLEALAAQLEAEGLDATSGAQLLDLLAAGPISEQLIAEVQRVVAGGGYAALEPRAQKRVLAEIEQARHQPAALAVITALLQVPGLRRLETRERIELLSFLLGPNANRDRRAMLREAWTPQRSALQELLSERTFRAADADAQGEMLRDFLYVPSQEVYFLEVNVFGGRSIISFGAPDARPTLSYGQISQLSLGGPFGTRIESPETCVASGFTAPIRDSLVVYTFHRVELSREEMRLTVEWIEGNHEIGGEVGSGELSRVLAAHRLMTNCFRMVSTFLGQREVEQGLMFEGRRTATKREDTDTYAERLMQAFLAA